MDREPTNIAELVAQINEELNDSKTDQIFGGDALIVNEYDAQLSNDASATYTLTLTPNNPDLGVLPSRLDLRWTNTNMNSQATNNYFAYQVYRSDGVFEWRITGGHVNDYDTYLTLQYLGEGIVNLTRTA